MTTNAEQKIATLLKNRQQELSALIGAPFEKIIELFTADLLGCLSGESNERNQAREWLLFCFHQYFGSGDFDKDNNRLKELRILLHDFSEPTTRELENEL